MRLAVDTLQTALDLLMKVWPKAVARVREEVADMQTLSDAEGVELTIDLWNYRYYTEKVRLQKIRPRLQRSETLSAIRTTAVSHVLDERAVVCLKFQPIRIDVKATYLESSCLRTSVRIWLSNSSCHKAGKP